MIHVDALLELDQRRDVEYQLVIDGRRVAATPKVMNMLDHIERYRQAIFAASNVSLTRIDRSRHCDGSTFHVMLTPLIFQHLTRYQPCSVPSPTMTPPTPTSSTSPSKRPRRTWPR